MSLQSALLRTLCAATLAAAATIAANAGEPGKSPGRKYTTIERMTLPRLEAEHNDVKRLQEGREPVKLQSGLHDYRSILHAHAEDSDHTGGKLPEMLEDAKKAGVQVIMLTDHYRPPRDFIDGRWRGLRDGVLFIPGSEAKGFLVYPEHSIMNKMDSNKTALISAVTADNGLIFLSHVEERRDHSMAGLTGMEVYNRHYDAMDDRGSLLALAGFLTNPAKYAEAQKALALYPDEYLATQYDYPQVYMDKWDAEMQKKRVVGIAADDCHHNQVFIAKMVDENTLLLGTIVDKEDGLRKLTTADAPTIPEMTKGKKPGDIVARLDTDPYYIFFRDVSTHILASAQTEEATRAALHAGHAYISHDWLCDPTGFVFGAKEKASDSAQPDVLMGDEIAMGADVQLLCEFPLACDFKLIKDGKVIKEGHDRSFEYKPDGPGAYRVEGWLSVDSEQRAWIYANPVYVR